jgi:HEAT repeat protein
MKAGRGGPKSGRKAMNERTDGGVLRLVRRLGSADPAARVHAALLLAERGEGAAEALPGLLEALAGPDPHARAVAAWTLGHVGRASPGEALPALARAAGDEDEGVRRLAGAALERLRLAA